MEGLNLNLVSTAYNLGQFVVELPDQPFAGGRAERLFQPDRHFGRNARPGIQQVAESLPINAKNSGGAGHTQPVLFKAIPPDRHSWVHRLSIRIRPDAANVL